MSVVHFAIFRYRQTHGLFSHKIWEKSLPENKKYFRSPVQNSFKYSLTSLLREKVFLFLYFHFRFMFNYGKLRQTLFTMNANFPQNFSVKPDAVCKFGG